MQGNHDHGEMKFVRAAATDLERPGRRRVCVCCTNECVTVRVGAAALQLCGVDDCSTATATWRRCWCESTGGQAVLRLLLSHYRRSRRALAPGDFALILSGDTHGGQICLPWFGGRVMLSQPRAQFREGFYRCDGAPSVRLPRHGYELPALPLPGRPEVVVFRLRAAGEPPGALRRRAATLSVP